MHDLSIEIHTTHTI